MENAIKKDRRSGLELLRIIAMLLIVFGHFYGQSEMMRYIDPHSVTNIIVLIFGNASRISVNLFLIIAVWFMVEREFQAERLINTWLTVLVWSIISSIVAGFCGSEFEVKTILQCFFPILGRPLWFASAYMILYMCSPFLNAILKWERKTLVSFLCILFLFCCLIHTITKFNETFTDNVLWFIFVFLFIGYIKLYYSKFIGKHYILDGILGIILYLVLIFAKYSSELFNCYFLQNFSHLASSYLINIKSIPNFVCALLIFFFFNKINLKNKTINRLAIGSFPVYIVHQTRAFYPILWTWILNVSCSEDGVYNVLKSFVAIVLFYFIITFLEINRRNITFFNKTNLYQLINKKIMDIY